MKKTVNIIQSRELAQTTARVTMQWIEKTEPKELNFIFGVFAEPISKQYEKHGFRLKYAESWDHVVRCATTLYIHNILTERSYDEALMRIIKFSKKDIIKVKLEE